MRTTATARWKTRRTAAAWACCSSRSRSTSAIRPSWRRAKLGRCACTCPQRAGCWIRRSPASWRSRSTSCFCAGTTRGVDQRVLDRIVDMELSIGDYVLTGGELPAAVAVDCIARLVPGVLAEEECFTEESHYGGLLGIRTTRARRFSGRVRAGSSAGRKPRRNRALAAPARAGDHPALPSGYAAESEPRPATWTCWKSGWTGRIRRY